MIKEAKTKRLEIRRRENEVIMMNERVGGLNVVFNCFASLFTTRGYHCLMAELLWLSSLFYSQLTEL
jgi:hypothetical protein